MNKMDLENQKVLVAGLGKSGMAAYEPVSYTHLISRLLRLFVYFWSVVV